MRLWVPGFRSLLVSGGALLMALILVGVANAEFMEPDLEKIPLKRLLENLQAKVDGAPKDAAWLGTLARAYGMAYAAGLNDDSLVERRRDHDEVWFGFVPDHVPFACRLNGEPGENAKGYLAHAIECYRKSLDLAPENLANRLGLAWCTEQSGQVDEARKLYRGVIEAAWGREGTLTGGGMQEFVTSEAARYLLRLLDPKNDAKEIADLEEKVRHLESIPRPITPIAIPLEDDLSREDMEDQKGAIFDLDGTGRQWRWRWVKPNAAWLVYDHDDSGLITSAVQMFGNRTFNLIVRHGYAAMSMLDDDRNGTLEGDELKHLALWQDLNGNGISEPGEVRPLKAWSITALSCRGEMDENGMWSCSRGVTYRDGSTRRTYDMVMKWVE